MFPFMKRLFFLLFILFNLLPGRANSAAADSIQLSLLTCAPGSEIYSLWGHTAIRYQNFTQKKDWVFNYGMFSFKTPHFVYRFVKGETDYQLGVTPYEYFESEYALRGSSVIQQTLNLTQEEKVRLYQLLLINYQPENRVYRYNYFFDNCTTRARDMIERAIQGKVVYPADPSEASFRSDIHLRTTDSPWGELGIDLCLGSEADEPIGVKERQFSPYYMMESARKAVITQGNQQRPLLSSETKIVDVEPYVQDSSYPSPLLVCWGIFILGAILSAFRLKTGKRFWAWDVFWLFLQGVSGCVIAFLFFFSTHPTVGSNWMLLFLQPLPLFYLPWLIYHEFKGMKEPFYLYNAIYLTFFIILIPVIPQDFNSSVLPLALNLLVSSVSRVWMMRRK